MKTINMLSLLAALSVTGSTLAADLTRPVAVVEDGETEFYLGTQFGQTLYTFDLDENGASACTGTCAEKWPPLLVTADEAAALVAPLGTITRANGLLQVTHAGKPVYTFYLDHAEGDDKGDGVGGVWHDIEVEAPGKGQ